jgi:hypothetical protein
MLRHALVFSAAAMLAGSAIAQPGQNGSHNPALKNGAPHAVSAPAHGANSFTAQQARGRFAKAGYTRVSGLKKADGLWRAMAVKHGRQQAVMLDYKGNITTH